MSIPPRIIQPFYTYLSIVLDLQQGQPHLYENLIKILNPEEQQVIQGVVDEADAHALAAEAVNAELAKANGGA